MARRWRAQVGRLRWLRCRWVPVLWVGGAPWPRNLEHQTQALEGHCASTLIRRYFIGRPRHSPQSSLSVSRSATPHALPPISTFKFRLHQTFNDKRQPIISPWQHDCGGHLICDLQDYKRLPLMSIDWRRVRLSISRQPQHSKQPDGAARHTRAARLCHSNRKPTNREVTRPLAVCVSDADRRSGLH